MALATAAQNAAAAGVAGVAGFLSLHTGDPSTTGANEVTGGSPAYARKAVTYAAAGSGQDASNASVTFDVPAGTTVLWVGMFTLVTGGTWEGAAPPGGQTPKPATVIASTDIFTSPGHGLANTDRVVVFDTMGGGVPTGLTEGTTYFVVGVSGNTFQVSLTSGGSAVDVTADGFCWYQKSLPENFVSQGQLTIPSGSFILDGRAA